MFQRTALHSVLGGLALVTLPGGVSAFTVIDFDSDAAGDAIVNGQVIDNEYAAWGVSISAVNARKNHDRAVAFDTSPSSTRDPDLEAPFFDFVQEDFADAGDKSEYSFSGDQRDGENGQINPGNVLIIQENSTGCGDGVCDQPDDEGGRPAGHFSISFDTPVFLRSIDFFDIEVAEDGQRPENAITLEDSSGNEILADTFYTPNTGGDFNVDNTSYDGQLSGRTNNWDRLFFGNALVAMIKINMGGSGAIDNIAFSRTTVPVPAPATLLAFGAALLWRRRSAAGQTAA